MEWLYCLVLGAVIGVISSFLGIGGGILIVPLLPSFADVSSREAVATSLFTVLLVASKNVYGFQKKKLVPWGPAINLALGAALSTFLASLVLHWIAEVYLVLSLAVVLLLVALRLFFPTTAISELSVPETKTAFDFRALLAGLFFGGVVGVTGVGGGIVYGPLLIGLRMVSDAQMSPGSNVVMMLASFMASLGFFWQAESIDWTHIGLIRIDLAFAIFAAAFFTSQYGLKFQDRIHPDRRRLLMACLLLLMFVKTMYRYFSLV